MSRKYLQELIKSLQEFYRCPSCETNYYLDDIRFLGQIDRYCFVQLNCHSCSLPVLATVSLGNQTIVPVNDLKPREQEKFEKKGQITASEIADFHRFISDFQGDFGKLLK